MDKHSGGRLEIDVGKLCLPIQTEYKVLQLVIDSSGIPDYEYSFDEYREDTLCFCIDNDQIKMYIPERNNIISEFSCRTFEEMVDYLGRNEWARFGSSLTTIKDILLNYKEEVARASYTKIMAVSETKNTSKKEISTVAGNGAVIKGLTMNEIVREQKKRGKSEGRKQNNDIIRRPYLSDKEIKELMRFTKGYQINLQSVKQAHQFQHIQQPIRLSKRISKTSNLRSTGLLRLLAKRERISRKPFVLDKINKDDE